MTGAEALAAALEGPKLFNLWIAVFVVAIGGLIGPKANSAHQQTERFPFYTYLLWWLSWVMWVLTWAVLTLFEGKGPEDLKTLAELGSSDINSVLLFVAALILLRAGSFQPADAMFSIVGSLAIVGITHTALHYFFGFGSEPAFHLQQSLAMCLAAASPAVFGWAMSQKYSSPLPLAAGLIYGLLQPVAFLALFHKDHYGGSPVTLANALILLGVMKVVWAVVVGRYLLIPVSKAKDIKFFAKDPVFLLQAGGLTVASLVTFFILHPVDWQVLGGVITLSGGSLALLKGIYEIWKKF